MLACFLLAEEYARTSEYVIDGTTVYSRRNRKRRGPHSTTHVTGSQSTSETVDAAGALTCLLLKRHRDWVLVLRLRFMFHCLRINRKQIRRHNHRIFSVYRKHHPYADVPPCRADATVTVRVVGPPSMQRLSTAESRAERHSISFPLKSACESLLAFRSVLM